MNVLLIDNGTTLLEKLKTLIPGEEIVYTWKEFTDEQVGVADLIVLSGGSTMQLIGNEQEFARETEMIRTAAKPIIGLCFGCELITLAFGGTLRELAEPHKGIREIELLSPELLAGKTSINVFENHRWIIDSIPEHFNVLARSSDGPEMIRHAILPIYGLQFHPENMPDQTEGDELFLNLVKPYFPL